jgi:hypothetical protein
VYCATLAPELTAGAALAAPMIRLPTVAAAGTAGRALGVLVGAGLLTLLAVAGWSLRDRVTAAAGSRGDVLWVVLVAAASILATVAIDPWAVLTTGLGLGASAGAAPLRAGGGRAAVAGAVSGAAAFGVLALGGPVLADTLGALAAWPALVAAPLAWGITTVAARPWNLAGWCR